jgi:hypothetical protein
MNNNQSNKPKWLDKDKHDFSKKWKKFIDDKIREPEDIKSVRDKIQNTLKEILFESDNPCWKGYKQVGMKEKNGKQVPNCVPIKSKKK